MLVVALMASVHAVTSTWDAKFPDYTNDDLKMLAARVTLESVSTVEWRQRVVDPPGTGPWWQPPPEILQCIPDEILDRLAPDRKLVVRRNIDIVDLFAGAARISRWAALANLRPMAIDKVRR